MNEKYHLSWKGGEIEIDALGCKMTPVFNLNGKIHYLISSVCFVKNGSMVWNYSERSELKMRKIDKSQITNYLNKIPVSTLLAYGVYQVEASGKELFEYIKGDENSIMGLPIKQIKQYIKNYK